MLKQEQMLQLEILLASLTRAQKAHLHQLILALPNSDPPGPPPCAERSPYLLH